MHAKGQLSAEIFRESNQHALGKHASGLHKLRIVEQDKRLQWGVGRTPSCHAIFTGGGIKGQHGRWWSGAFPVSVKASSMQAFALVRLIGRARDFFPDPSGLIGLHAGAAQFGRQDPCRTQCLITKHLGHESQARATSQPEIFWIPVRHFSGWSGIPTVCLRGDHELEQPFDIPSRIHEGGRQPVQQLGVTGLCPLASEVFGGHHQSSPKEHLPKTIDHHS